MHGIQYSPHLSPGITTFSIFPTTCHLSHLSSHPQVRSFTSTASTIHPDQVKARVKAALEKRGRRGEARRQVAKGEASAKTRSRRSNKETIQGSTSAFWMGD